MRTVVALLTLLSLAAGAQQRVALRDGVIVHPTESTAYVMLPQGGVGAVDLTTGAMRWTSTAAAKPLAIAGRLLVSQAEPKNENARNCLELVALDVKKRGAAAVRSSVALPTGVYAATRQNFEGRFVATARVDGRNAIVTWSWKPMPIRGVAPTPEERYRKLSELTGMVRMNLANGRTASSAVDEQGVIPPASSTWLLNANERLAVAKTGQQYESADGRHVLQSERVTGGTDFDAYRWTIFDRKSGARLGETRSHLSFAPFVVRGGMLVFETTPFGRTPNESEPATLRGVQLASGKERWSVAIGEVVYRGPLPP